MQLGPDACPTIERAVQAAGAEAVQAFSAQAADDARQGGIQAADGTHLLKAGEIFLSACYAALSPAARAGLTVPAGHRIAPRPVVKATPPPPAPAAPAVPKGATFKAIVAGRPQNMEAKKDYVVLTLLAARLPSLPKGLPKPPPPGKIVVYVAVRQFDKIADQLAAHPEDLIVVEGYTAQEGGQPVVFATNCTTKLLQQAKKEQQIAAAAAAAKPSE